MIRGTARQTHMVAVPTEPRFRSVVSLAKWHLTQGRASFGGAKAIQYDRAGSHRDAFAARRGQALFALTTLCLAAVTDEAQARVLALAYGAGFSDERIAIRHGGSATMVRRDRNRGLRAVRAAALRLNSDAAREAGQPLLPEDDR